MKQGETVLTGYELNVTELKMTISDMALRFDEVKVDDDSDSKAMNKMIAIGKALKNLLDIPVMDRDGLPNKMIKTQISGSLKID